MKHTCAAEQFGDNRQAELAQEVCGFVRQHYPNGAFLPCVAALAIDRAGAKTDADQLAIRAGVICGLLPHPREPETVVPLD